MPQGSCKRALPWAILLGATASGLATWTLRQRRERARAPRIDPERLREAMPEREAKAVAYTRIRYATFFLDEALGLGLLLAMQRHERPIRLREWAERHAKSPGLRDALFTSSLLALSSAITLPFSFVSGHLVERAFGLSRQSALSWMADAAKSLAVSLGIAVPATAGLYAIIRRSPQAWWLWGAGASSLLTVALTHIAPVVIDPLFFRYRPLRDEALSERLVGLARRAGVPVVGAFEADYSRKTTKANAYLTGVGSTRRIVLTDTLLQGYTHDEIAVILAHELGHHRFGHLRTGIVLGGLGTLAGFAIADGVLTRAGSRPGYTGKGDIATLPSLALFLGLASTVLMPAGNALSRVWERQCDRFALDMTRQPDAFIGVMRKLAAQNLADPAPSALIEALLYTHPSIGNRIRMALRWEALNAERAE